MTKKQLRRAVLLVVACYATLGLIAFLMRTTLPEGGGSIFEGYQVMVPYIFAIPAALLGYAFQQRGSYLLTLRALWSQLVRAVNAAIQYTLDAQPTERQYTDVLTQLAIAIDEVRGAYLNVGETESTVGLYPYEPIKTIYQLVHDLGYAQTDELTRRETREVIIQNWQSIRKAFLAEFDRAEPTEPVTEPRST
jgi:hypothetical protein